MDGRKLFLALAALLVVILAAFGLATNDRGITRGDNKVDLASAGDEPEAAPDDRQYQALCASSATYSRLKEVAFEEAFRIRNSDPANLDRLAASSVVRMENPRLKSHDDGSDVVVCSGRLVLELPPGAERAFEGQRRLVADVEYSAQAGEAGSGNVFQLNGAESIIYRLASFELPNAPAAPAANEQVEFAEATPSPAVGGPEEDEIEADEPRESEATRAAAVPTRRQAERPSPRPTPSQPARQASRADARPTPRPTQTAEREREPDRPRASSNPSFNCRYGRSRSEQMVCSSSRLAAKDRAMSSLFYSALSDADPRTRRELRRTRDRFLSYRERCRDEACVAEAYDGRMQEIRDIMEGVE